MTEVICLDDSDDEVDLPPPPRPPPKSPVQPPSGRPPRSEWIDPSAYDDDLASSDDDDGIFTDRHAKRRAAKSRRVGSGAGASTAAASESLARSPRRTEGVPSSRDQNKADKALARESAKAAKALEAESAKQKKANARELTRQNKEREKILKQNEKHRAALLGGKMKLQQITMVMSTDLGPDDFGRSLRDACNLGVKSDGGKGVVPLLHNIEQLPLTRSVTWRYHAPSTSAVGVCGDVSAPDGAPSNDEYNNNSNRSPGQSPIGADVRSAAYTLVLLTGERFADMCAVDFQAGVNVTGTRSSIVPPNGLKSLLQQARSNLPGHTLGLLIEGLRQHCSRRERREFRTMGADGFSRKNVEQVMAQLAVCERGIRVTSVSDRAAAITHLTGVSVALAKRPYEKELGFLDILAHSKGTVVTPAASLALERVVAGGSRGHGVGPDGSGLFPSQSIGSQPTNASVPPSGTRKVKSPAEVWCGALMTVDGCAEPTALAIVRAYPTMATLMREYADPNVTDRQKKELLSNLVRVQTSDTQSADRKVGPVLSARVFSILKPRGSMDPGDEIVGVGGG